MYSALIIDDEADARAVLTKLLELFCPEVSRVAEARTAAEALRLAASHSFDLAFIDIRLRQSNGLTLADQLQDYCPNLIFVTAHDRYAAAAYRTEAIDYLLKPVNPEHLKMAIARANLSAPLPPDDQRLLLHSKSGVTVLIQAEIIRVRGEGNYSTFYCLDNKKYVVSKNLSHYESQLDTRVFYRIHQSHLVNLAAVRECLSQQGKNYALMTNGDRIPVARRRKDGFVAALKNYAG